ncbi:MAG: hypothetical protein KKF48_01565 [Nanoarchaeota archaeon]|nr:hypothetical protein [Nanoarchaeota archaeon]MBU1027709.1 hypothetical protein [Nanoarchaeota archaeon]
MTNSIDKNIDNYSIKNLIKRETKIATYNAFKYAIGMPLKGLVVYGVGLPFWAVKKILVDRIYKIDEDEVGVVFQGHKLFKKKQGDVAMNLYEQILETRGNEFFGEQTTADQVLYKENKDIFLPRAKIVGPGIYYKLPFTKIVRVDVNKWPINPEPRSFPTETKGGIVIEMDVDLRARYQKIPIPFSFINFGRIMRNDTDWEKDLEKNVETEAYNIISEHFEKYDFPGILTNPINSPSRIKQKKIMKDIGVKIFPSKEGYKVSESQKDALTNALVEQQRLAESGRIHREDFVKAINAIEDLAKNSKYSGDFFRLLEEFRKFKQGYERIPIHPIQIKETN